MANKQKGEFTLKAGKQRYTLRLTTNAVCELEDFAGAMNKAGDGRTWDQVLAGIDKGSLKDVRLFFWVALREHHPDIATDDVASLKAVGTIIDQAGGLMGVAKQITALVTLNAADTSADDDEPEVPTTTRPPDAQAGTGAGSTPTH
jgi:hypothetical protein